MKRSLLILSVLCFSLLLLASGCKKNVTNPIQAVDENVQSSEDNALIDGEFSAIFAYTDAQGNLSYSNVTSKHVNPTSQGVEIVSSLFPDCANVAFDTTNKTLTIDFGTSNCLCRDGHYRKGKIIAQFTGKWRVVGSSVNISLQDYYVDDMNVQGTRTISISAEHQWTDNVQNASIQTPTGTISWNATRTFTKIAGYDTPLDPLDDVYTIDGNSTGVNRKGVNFSVTTTTPLKKDISCIAKDFVSGILTIVNNDKNVTMSINYDPAGTEACDKKADVTVNGVVFHITLR